MRPCRKYRCPSSEEKNCNKEEKEEKNSKKEQVCYKTCCKYIGVVSSSTLSSDIQSKAAALIAGKLFGAKVIVNQYEGNPDASIIDSKLDELYDKGIRCFILSNSTSRVQKSVQWAIDHPKAVFISPYSTGVLSPDAENIWRMTEPDSSEVVTASRANAVNSLSPGGIKNLCLIVDSNDTGFSVPLANEVEKSLTAIGWTVDRQNLVSVNSTFTDAQVQTALASCDGTFGANNYVIFASVLVPSAIVQNFNNIGTGPKAVFMSNADQNVTQWLGTGPLYGTSQTVQKSDIYGQLNVNSQSQAQVSVRIPLTAEGVYFLRSCGGNTGLPNTPVGLSGGWDFDGNNDRRNVLVGTFRFNNIGGYTLEILSN